jgi:hypothetical protein
MIRISRWAALALAAAAAACDGGGGGGGGGPVQPEPQPKPILLSIVSGNAQGGAVDEVLGSPLVVRATQDGQPVPNLSVDFQANAGSVNLAVVTTGGTGEAAVQWRLPADTAAMNGARVVARLTATPATQVSFEARLLRPDEMDLVIGPSGVPVKLAVYDRANYIPGQVSLKSFTDSTHVFFGNPAVRDEIVAFTPGRAPALIPSAWTPGRDTVRVQFAQEVIRIPLTIWVVEPPFDSTVVLAQRHLQFVAESWEAQAGIGLRDVRIVDATGFPGAGDFQGTVQQPCANAIQTQVGWDAGRMNAYYTGQPPIGSAVYCGGGWMEIFPLSWQRWPTTLAHEIGHGMLGGHHETVPNNVMHFRGEGATFSAGQMFRAHYWNQSILNTMFNGHPAEQRVACAPLPDNGNQQCLPTSFVIDW